MMEQWRLRRNLIDCCYSSIYDSTFKVEDFDNCGQTLRDVAHDEARVLAGRHPCVLYELAEIEQVSDDPRKEINISFFLTELGNQFLNSFNEGVLFNFEVNEPSPELSRIELTKLLEARLLSKIKIEFFESINHPELMDIRRLFVLKKLRGTMSGEWLADT